jgi:hypothetical protein
MTIPASTADKNYCIVFEVLSGRTGNDVYNKNLGSSGLVEGDNYPIYCSSLTGLTSTTTASVAKNSTNWIVRIKAAILVPSRQKRLLVPLGDRPIVNAAVQDKHKIQHDV